MPNTFTQIYIHVVFAVKGRQNLIYGQHREELHKYITGIVQSRDNKMLAIFCMPDHAHMLIGLKPSGNISDLIRDIKASSSGFINKKKNGLRVNLIGRKGLALSLTQRVKGKR